MATQQKKILKPKILRENQAVKAIRMKFAFSEDDWEINFYNGKRKIPHNSLNIVVNPKEKR